MPQEAPASRSQLFEARLKEWEKRPKLRKLLLDQGVQYWLLSPDDPDIKSIEEMQFPSTAADYRELVAADIDPNAIPAEDRAAIAETLRQARKADAASSVTRTPVTLVQPPQPPSASLQQPVGGGVPVGVPASQPAAPDVDVFEALGLPQEARFTQMVPAVPVQRFLTSEPAPPPPPLVPKRHPITVTIPADVIREQQAREEERAAALEPLGVVRQRRRLTGTNLENLGPIPVTPIEPPRPGKFTAPLPGISPGGLAASPGIISTVFNVPLALTALPLRTLATVEGMAPAPWDIRQELARAETFEDVKGAVFDGLQGVLHDTPMQGLWDSATQAAVEFGIDPNSKEYPIFLKDYLNAVFSQGLFGAQSIDPAFGQLLGEWSQHMLVAAAPFKAPMWLWTAASKTARLAKVPVKAALVPGAKAAERISALIAKNRARAAKAARMVQEEVARQTITVERAARLSDETARTLPMEVQAARDRYLRLSIQSHVDEGLIPADVQANYLLAKSGLATGTRVDIGDKAMEAVAEWSKVARKAGVPRYLIRHIRDTVKTARLTDKGLRAGIARLAGVVAKIEGKKARDVLAELVPEGRRLADLPREQQLYIRAVLRERMIAANKMARRVSPARELRDLDPKLAADVEGILSRIANGEQTGITFLDTLLPVRPKLDELGLSPIFMAFERAQLKIVAKQRVLRARILEASGLNPEAAQKIKLGQPVGRGELRGLLSYEERQQVGKAIENPELFDALSPKQQAAYHKVRAEFDRLYRLANRYIQKNPSYAKGGPKKGSGATPRAFIVDPRTGEVTLAHRANYLPSYTKQSIAAGGVARSGIPKDLFAPSMLERIGAVPGEERIWDYAVLLDMYGANLFRLMDLTAPKTAVQDVIKAIARAAEDPTTRIATAGKRTELAVLAKYLERWTQEILGLGATDAEQAINAAMVRYLHLEWLYNQLNRVSEKVAKATGKPPRIRTINDNHIRRLAGLTATSIYGGTLGYNFNAATRNLLQTLVLSGSDVYKEQAFKAALDTSSGVWVKWRKLGILQEFLPSVERQLGQADVMAAGSLGRLVEGELRLFRGSDELNRVVTAEGAYLRLMDLGLDAPMVALTAAEKSRVARLWKAGRREAAAIEYARAEVGTYQFLYNVVASPVAFRGAGGKLLGQLLTWPSNYIGGILKPALKQFMSGDPEMLAGHISGAAAGMGLVWMLGFDPSRMVPPSAAVPSSFGGPFVAAVVPAAIEAVQEKEKPRSAALEAIRRVAVPAPFGGIAVARLMRFLTETGMLGYIEKRMDDGLEGLPSVAQAVDAMDAWWQTPTGLRRYKELTGSGSYVRPITLAEAVDRAFGFQHRVDAERWARLEPVFEASRKLEIYEREAVKKANLALQGGSDQAAVKALIDKQADTISLAWVSAFREEEDRAQAESMREWFVDLEKIRIWKQVFGLSGVKRRYIDIETRMLIDIKASPWRVMNELMAFGILAPSGGM